MSITSESMIVIGNHFLGQQLATIARQRGLDVKIYDTEKIDTDPAMASMLAQSHIVVEALEDDLEVKQRLWQRLADHVSTESLLVTVTRHVLPHEVLPDTPESDTSESTLQRLKLLSRLVGIHWVLPLPNGVIEIAPTAYTQPKWQQTAQEWVSTLGLPSILLSREQRGYASIPALQALLEPAYLLWKEGVAQPKDIDMVWQISAATEKGPFALMKQLPLETLALLGIENTDLSLQEALQQEAFPEKVKQAEVNNNNKSHTINLPEINLPEINLPEKQINRIAIIGAGVLGSQIAFQTAYCGFSVCSYDLNEEALQEAMGRFQYWAQAYQNDLGATAEQIAATLERIQQTIDFEQAVKEADFIIEAVSEDEIIKRQVLSAASNLNETAVISTNTSTLSVSELATSVHHPERFLATHFANMIWLRNITEVMGHENTSDSTIKLAIYLMRNIGMQVAHLEKEKAGYIINSLAVPVITCASHLLMSGLLPYKEIDNLWRITTNSQFGPFESIDIIGIRNVYDVHCQVAEELNSDLSRRFVEMLKTEYLDKGAVGAESGQGFYIWKDGEIVRES